MNLSYIYCKEDFFFFMFNFLLLAFTFVSVDAHPMLLKVLELAYVDLARLAWILRGCHHCT